MILRHKKIIFVHAPRTSGTSIESCILNEQLVPDHVKHLRASQFKKMLGPLWEEYFKFTIVRNPWDRVISMYHQPYNQDIGFLSGKSLEHFLKNYRPAPWEHGIQCSDYADTNMDLVIKFEDRATGLKILHQKTGIYVNPSVKKRGTNRKITGYREYYSDKTKEMVKEMFLEDIKRYQYEF